MVPKTTIIGKGGIFLVWLAVIAFTGTASAATYSGGNGTAEQPYRISTPEDMNAIGANQGDWSSHFVMVNDINLADYTGTQFNIIGTDYYNPFSGVFDGNGCTIYNFTYTASDISYIGLFGSAGGTEVIKDLTLVDPNINAAGYAISYVGCLVGRLVSGTITDCGIEGGSVSGLNITGGLVGYNGGTISNCYAASSVSGTNDTGGLAGYNYYGTISNCYATGNVTGNDRTGGLVGPNNSGSILNSYAGGSVTGTTNSGGLVGSNSGVVFNSFWDVNSTGLDISAGGKGKTTVEMMTMSTFFGWGCTLPVWTIAEYQDYPRLAWQDKPGEPIAPTLSDFLDGAGTQEQPYLIYNAQQLNLIGRFSCGWDKHFKLTGDIDLAAYTGTEFNIIGIRTSGFTGVFDGNGHTISNFTYTTDDPGYIGFFGYVDDANAMIKDLTLVAPYVNATRVPWYAGCLVGWLQTGTITGCSVEGGSVTGTILTGGLVGYNAGTVSSSYTTVSVLGVDEWTGGLVGKNVGAISDCYAAGSVSGHVQAGGLVGQNLGTVSNSYATASVTGYSNIGGLMGLNYYGTISNCYAAGSVSGARNVGGLVGYDSSGNYTSSFWNHTVNPSLTGIGSITDPAEVIGESTVNMQTQSTFTDAGWDFVGEVVNGPNDIWDICEGTNYPKLAWQIPLLGDFVCPDGVEIEDLDVFTQQWLLEKLSADVAVGGGDGIVDFLDWAVFANTWQNTTDLAQVLEFAQQWLQFGAYCADIAPAGGDNKVDMLDFAVLAGNWLAGVGQ